MSNVSVFKVHFHYEKGGVKGGWSEEQRVARVVAAAGDNSTLKTALTNNSYGAPSGYTIVIDQVQNVADGVS